MPAAVQRISKTGTGTSLSIGAVDGWSTPTSGNLIVLTANGDNTISTPSGYTAGPSVVDDNAAYLWWKISDGTESTVSVTENGSTDWAFTACEYSGITASPFDASNSSTITVTEGTTTTSTSVTTTAAGDLVIAVAGIYRFTNSFTASGPSWTNSFTNQLAQTLAGTTNRGAIFYGELVAGAAGSVSTACSWTGNMTCRQELIIAFKAAAGGGAPAYVPGSAQRRRLPAAPRLMRGSRISSPIRAQSSPPPASVGSRPFRQLRGLLPRRGRGASPVPAQVVVVPPAYPPTSVRPRVRWARLFRGRSASPVPPQVVVVPPPYVPQAGRPRLKWQRLFHGRAAAPVAVQPAVLAVTHPRPRVMARRRGRVAMPTPPQVVIVPPAYVPTLTRIRRRLAGLFRGRAVTPVASVCDCTTHRPNLGSTARPSSGVTARPDTGTTARPCSCGGD